MAGDLRSHDIRADVRLADTKRLARLRAKISEEYLHARFDNEPSNGELCGYILDLLGALLDVEVEQDIAPIGCEHDWVVPTSMNGFPEKCCGRCGMPYRLVEHRED